MTRSLADGLGLDIKAIREAHRYCTTEDHGGHRLEDCPMYRDFFSMTREIMEHERAMERSHRERHALYKECRS